MANDKKRLAEHKGSVSVTDDVLTMWLERAFQGETPNEINVYPMERKGGWVHRLTQLYHYDVKANEKVSGSRAAELANIIRSEISADCNSRNKGEWHYEVEVVDHHRGSAMKPVATKHIREMPQFPRDSREDDEDDAEDGYGGARKAMVDLIRLGIENEREKEQNGLQAANETALVLLDAVKDGQNQIRQLVAENRNMAKEVIAAARQTAAMAIEDKDHEEDRADRRAARNSKHLLVEFAAETLKEVRTLFPSFAAMILSDATDKPAHQVQAHEEKKALGDGEKPPVVDVGPSDERTLIAKILKSIKDAELDDLLFGTDDDDGNPLTDGIFTRDQARVMLEVSNGLVRADALDPFIPTSGSPLAVTDDQLKLARPKVPLGIIGDMMKLMVMRSMSRRSKSAT